VDYLSGKSHLNILPAHDDHEESRDMYGFRRIFQEKGAAGSGSSISTSTSVKVGGESCSGRKPGK
jgi:hypothetical protein